MKPFVNNKKYFYHPFFFFLVFRILFRRLANCRLRCDKWAWRRRESSSGSTSRRRTSGKAEGRFTKIRFTRFIPSGETICWILLWCSNVNLEWSMRLKHFQRSSILLKFHILLIIYRKGVVWFLMNKNKMFCTYIIQCVECQTFTQLFLFNLSHKQITVVW